MKFLVAGKISKYLVRTTLKIETHVKTQVAFLEPVNFSISPRLLFLMNFCNKKGV